MFGGEPVSLGVCSMSMFSRPGRCGAGLLLLAAAVGCASASAWSPDDAPGERPAAGSGDGMLVLLAADGALDGALDGGAAATTTQWDDGPAATPLAEPALLVQELPEVEPAVLPGPAPSPPPAPLPDLLCALLPGLPPQSLTVAVGQTVVFDNRDRICHGLFSTSVGNAFELAVMKPGTQARVQFVQPGTVQVYCSLHQHHSLTIRVGPVDGAR